MQTTLASAAKEFSEWSQEEFVRRVRPFSDQFNPGHPGYGLPEDFNWTFREGFPLTRLAGKTAEWRAWSAEESAAWVEDYAPHPKEHFEVYWLPHPWHDPVILVEGTDRLFYTWDGNHRIGVALCARLRTVPAIVGFRTPQFADCAPALPPPKHPHGGAPPEFSA
jgi:hypothetical protein